MPQPSAQNKSVIPKGYLRRRSDFLKTYKGWFVRQNLLVFYARKNELETHRFGITAPKSVGTAVVRNKYKRWCKVVYRSIDFKISAAVDMNVFIGNKRLKREDFKNATFREFERQLKEAFESLVRNF